MPLADPAEMRLTGIVDDVALDEIELADGRRMTIRTTTVEDGELIRALYEELTVDDRHRRFFGAFRPRSEWCRRWASIGERGGFGVIATVLDPDGSEVAAGEAGYALREDGDGDLAVTVATTWRGWLGPYLLDVLISHAAEVGIANLQADVLLENGPMLSMLRRRDPVAMGHDEGVVRLSIGTTGTTPTWPPKDDRPRVLIEIAGRRWSGEGQADQEGLATAICSGPGGRVRHGCPVLEGGRCPLADGADAILMLLDPDDERSQRLVESHRRYAPGRPVLVRAAPGSSADGDVADPCVEVAGDGTAAVAQLLSLIGQRS